jgi:hypothetical protein
LNNNNSLEEKNENKNDKEKYIIKRNSFKIQKFSEIQKVYLNII